MKTKAQHLAMSIMIALASLVSASAQDKPSIDGIATDDVIAIAFANLKETDLGGLLERVIEMKLIEDEQVDKPQMAVFSMGQEVVRQLINAGGDHLFCLIRQADIENLSVPLFAISVVKNGSLDKLQKRVREIADALKGLKVASKGDFVVVGLSAAVDAFVADKDSAREDLVNAWQASDISNAGLVLTGDRDSRRVMRELFPSMKAPYEKVTGKLIADRLEFGSLALKLNKDFAGKLTVHAKDAAAAGVVVDAYRAFAAQLEDPDTLGATPMAVAAPLFTQLNPVVEGKRVELDFGKVLADPTALVKALAPIRNSARSKQTVNNMRQLILAMLNYVSAYQAFPKRAITDGDGKPLLSWRVQILPFLGQNELYSKFKLDEPWDSPHNKKLLVKMPEIFASPFPGGDKLAAAGKTRFQVISTEGCGFGTNEPLTFKQITDGSSNTIAIVRANIDQAVEWTRPRDLKVDLGEPGALMKDDDGQIYYANFDGSTHVTRKFSDKALKAALTLAGGEVLDWNSVER